MDDGSAPFEGDDKPVTVDGLAEHWPKKTAENVSAGEQGGRPGRKRWPASEQNEFEKLKPVSGKS